MTSTACASQRSAGLSTTERRFDWRSSPSKVLLIQGQQRQLMFQTNSNDQHILDPDVFTVLAFHPCANSSMAWSKSLSSANAPRRFKKVPSRATRRVWPSTTALTASPSRSLSRVKSFAGRKMVSSLTLLATTVIAHLHSSRSSSIVTETWPARKRTRKSAGLSPVHPDCTLSERPLRLLTGELARVVQETLRPEGVSVWLKEQSR